MTEGPQCVGAASQRQHPKGALEAQTRHREEARPG